MFRKNKTLCTKHRELFIYILVGGGTTAAAWGCKYLCNLFFFAGTAFPNAGQNSVLSIVENAAAIAYAYPANRKWVFRSTEPQILPELAKFYRLPHSSLDSRLADEHAAGQRPECQHLSLDSSCWDCRHGCELFAFKAAGLPRKRAENTELRAVQTRCCHGHACVQRR